MTFLTILLGWMLAGFVLVMIPFFIVGYVMSGWRPYLTSLVLWAIATVVFKSWTFGWFSIVDYFIALAGYVAGGQVRTGKTTEQVMNGSAPDPKDSEVA